MQERLQSIIRRAAHWVLIICCRNGRLASLYYFVFSKKFDREHLSVLQGKRRYGISLTNIGESSPLLRRNIHRLEKGIIMRPRRAIFAEAFIEDTVACFQRACDNDAFDTLERKWARDVLEEYFSVVGLSPVIDRARAAYDEISTAEVIPGEQEEGFVPYDHRALPETHIKFEDLEDLYRRRRSVRWFCDTPVPADLVRKAVDIASMAPSACNRQPYRFLLSVDGERATQVAKCAGGTVGFAENIPAIIVVVGDLSSYPHEHDRHLIYIDASMAVMQLMLALEIQGLSTCPINWPDIQSAEDNIREIIALPGYQQVVMLVAVGYADTCGGIPFSQKKGSEVLMEELR